MKYTFTLLKIVRTLLLPLCCLFSAVQTMAQLYTPTLVESDPTQNTGYYTALAKDNSGNLYIAKYNGSSYQLFKWTGGNPATAVPLTLLASQFGDDPWGIAVNSTNNDVFVISADAGIGYQILRHVGGAGTATMVQQGKRYSAICLDNNNNLLAVEQSAGPGSTYQVTRYAADGSGGGQVLYNGIVDPGDGTYPWGIDTDADGNIYVTNFYNGGVGGIIKLTPSTPTFGRTDLLTGRFFTGLTIGADNTLYGVELKSGLTYKVTKFPNASGTGTEIYSGLVSDGVAGFPWGIVEMNGNLYVNDGSALTDINGGTCGGQVLKLTPPNIHLTSINRVTTTPTNANSVQFLVTFDGAATGVSASNFAVTVASGSVTGMSIDAVTGSGSTYTVTVNTGSGNGVIRLDMVNTTGITPTVATAMPFTAGQTILIDKTAPTGSVSISNGATYTNVYGVTLNLTGTDAGGSGGLEMAFSVQGGAYSPFEAFAATKAVTLSGPDGTKSVSMQLRDAAGNITTYSDDIILDMTAPQTGIAASPPALTNSSNASFQFTSDDPAATFEMELDPPSTYTPVGSPVTLSGLVEGSHTINVRAVDLAGNRDLTPESYTWVIDQTAPLVASVTVPANATYSAGQQLDFTVTYNENIAVNNSGGTPYLNVTIGSTSVQASYVSATGADVLFRYTVAAGDLDPDGITVNSPVVLNGGTIKDQAGNNANLTLNNIGNTSLVKVDAVGPVVTSVDVPAAGTYIIGNQLNFIVNFDENVTVTGAPSFPVTIGSSTVAADYVSGSGSDALLFRYTVQAGDNDNDGIAAGSAIALNGGTLKDGVDNNATLTLNSIGNTSAVLVNTKQPVPTITSATPSPVTGPFVITITFDDDISDNLLASHFVSLGATLSSVTRTGANTFTALITPPAGQQTGNGSVTVLANQVHNTVGNLNMASNTYSYTWDTKAPVITVTPPADKYYKAGEVISFTISYDEDVVVTGAPTLPIVIGAATRQATYSAGGDARTLVFNYTVATGDEDADGIDLGASIALNGGTISDLAGNNAPIAVASHYSGILVDGVAPTVTSVDVPANGYYKAGQTLSFTVHTSENITVTGAPTLGVNIGGAIRQAAFAGGSGSTALVFTYTVVAGDNDDDGIALDVLQLNGGALQDAAGNDMVLTLNSVANTDNVFVNTVIPTVTLSGTPVPNGAWTMTITFSEKVTGFVLTDITATNATLSALSTSDNIAYTVQVTGGADGAVSLSVPADAAINVGGNGNTASNTLTYTHDGTAPSITSVNAPASGGYKAGDELNFTVNFDENVTVTGTPSVPVTIGTTTLQATYVSGSGTGSLLFRYTVQNGDLDADGITVGAAIALNGGTIKDAATNNAVLTLNNVSSTSGVIVDAVAPVVTSVSVPADGYYKGGQQLDFTVHFSENVTPSAVPSIPVTIGSTVVAADYVSGSGTTGLRFTYTVQPGDMDMDGISVSGNIALNAGTIMDGVGNNAVLALNNVDPTNNVFVNTHSPTVTLSGTPVLNGSWTMTITFEEEVTGFTLADIAATNATLSAFSTSDNTTYTVQVTGNADGAVSLSVPANVATNVAGNGNAASNTITYTHDATGPAIATVNVPANGTYKAGDVLSFTVNFNENVTVTGTPLLPLTIGSAAVEATYTGGTGSSALTFSYTVQNGESDLDGIALGAALQLNGGAITDAATNNATLTINGAGSTAAVLVDALAPVITAVTVPADDYYKAGEALYFTVQFSEPVVTSGSTTTLPVTIGATTVQATIFSAPTTSSIVFRYVVQTGDLDMDGITVGGALVPGGTPIKDAAGNDASLTLNNVGSTSNVFVLANRPTVNIDGIISIRQPWTASIVFSHAVTGFTLADIGLTNAVASNLQTTDNITYTALISPVTEGGVSIEIPANIAEDAAGNLNTPSSRLSYYYDPNPPVITSVEVPANGYYKQGDVLNFAVNWSEVVKSNILPSTLTLPVIIGSTTVQAAYTAGFNSQRLTFAYTVQAGEMDLDGIQLGAALQLASAHEQFGDLSGNPAILT
ncbi:MAG TPA: Ig-like domain-containing protein, partial [Chitinophaga sp.]|uniref:Ig-like domain-containing protein n=1 Tax=Chitinophaga sp. TaxID=1869181 RepID=UPI002DB7A7C9